MKSKLSYAVKITNTKSLSEPISQNESYRYISFIIFSGNYFRLEIWK